jgi:hypothetical protein
MEAIPKDTALQLCAEIRRENRRKWYTPAAMMCRGCMTFSKGDPAKMCLSSQPGYRGCYQINARYDRQLKSEVLLENAQEGSSKENLMK